MNLPASLVAEPLARRRFAVSAHARRQYWARVCEGATDDAIIADCWGSPRAVWQSESGVNVLVTVLSSYRRR